MSRSADKSDTAADEALMQAFSSGDAEAFGILMRRHQRGVFNYLLRSVGSRARAEELLQDVFLRVVRSKERYTVTAKFTTWLYTIARNMLVDEGRRTRFRRHRSLETKAAASQSSDALTLGGTIAADQVPVDMAATAKTLRARIMRALDELPEDQREVFCLRQFAGLSFREIGGTVGVPENTAKSRMRYALERLRLELADLAPEETAGRTSQERVHG